MFCIFSISKRYREGRESWWIAFVSCIYALTGRIDLIANYKLTPFNQGPHKNNEYLIRTLRLNYVIFPLAVAARYSNVIIFSGFQTYMFSDLKYWWFDNKMHIEFVYMAHCKVNSSKQLENWVFLRHPSKSLKMFFFWFFCIFFLFIKQKDSEENIISRCFLSGGITKTISIP